MTFSGITLRPCPRAPYSVSQTGCADRLAHKREPIQLPPTLRGALVCGTNPRAVFVFQGWWVWCLGARGGGGAASGRGAAASALAVARTAAAWWLSFSRQHCLYLWPDPQWQSWLRPGLGLVEVIEESVPYQRLARRYFPPGTGDGSTGSSDPRNGSGLQARSLNRHPSRVFTNASSYLPKKSVSMTATVNQRVSAQRPQTPHRRPLPGQDTASR
jgi:hypothetical protein